MSIADAEDLLQVAVSHGGSSSSQDITTWVVFKPVSMEEGPGLPCSYLPGGIKGLWAIERGSDVKYKGELSQM